MAAQGFQAKIRIEVVVSWFSKGFQAAIRTVAAVLWLTKAFKPQFGP